ncbi:hypothetical protein N7520_010198 [Penicillium odoratum]|uniref:uncharacterized protein n=1 Tax=Penicillium odoratum TaxID=1167516 RepID=UPI0025465F0E|nr:uncharacterized protein N7520_010198 [Penicillium odoratum]KAJ5753281.1 hypothetical protein N7520_010198 [Penicillium odoratum]
MFFKKALATGKLSYAFNSPMVASILVLVWSLNVLNYVTFDPPLDTQRAAATNIGHVNQCVKVRAEFSNKDMRSWTGISYPFNKLTYAIGDGTTPAGNTPIVCFGGFHNRMHPEEDINLAEEAVESMAPGNMDIKRLLLSSSLDAMRARHENIVFANSDWAVGWRSFIDAAIEEGTRAAMTVKTKLQLAPPLRSCL